MNASSRSIWFWPLVLAASTIVGLVSALLGDGPWDVLSWFALGAPLVTAAVAAHRSRS